MSLPHFSHLLLPFRASVCGCVSWSCLSTLTVRQQKKRYHQSDDPSPIEKSTVHSHGTSCRDAMLAHDDGGVMIERSSKDDEDEASEVGIKGESNGTEVKRVR